MKIILGRFADGWVLTPIANEIIPLAAPRIKSRRVIECLSASGICPHFCLSIPSEDGDVGLTGLASVASTYHDLPASVTWLYNARKRKLDHAGCTQGVGFPGRLVRFSTLLLRGPGPDPEAFQGFVGKRDSGRGHFQ